jgi:hypothetical protein
VQHLKGRTAHAVRREFTGACVRARMRGHLWSPSYFAVSAEARRCPSSSSTSTAKPAHCERGAAPSDERDGLTHGLKPEACAQESGHELLPSSSSSRHARHKTCPTRTWEMTPR